MDQPKIAEIWGNVQQLMGVAGPYYGEAVQQAIQDVGMADLRLGLLLHTLQFEPLPITARALRRTIPYYATEPFEEGFKKLAERGFLAGDTSGFTLTAKGRQALITILEAAREKLAVAEKSLEVEILQDLYGLLKRLNDAAMDSQEITEKLCFEMQKRTVPSKTNSVLSEIEDLVSNLYGYRCDGHRQAWQGLDVDLDGPTWEALTAIWQGDANSVKTITDNRLNARPTRGFGADIYAKSVEKLVGYRWIEVDDAENETYCLTEMGKTVRQDAEAETDRLFYSIWSVLDESELVELNHLTLQICEQIKRVVAEA